MMKLADFGVGNVITIGVLVFGFGVQWASFNSRLTEVGKLAVSTATKIELVDNDVQDVKSWRVNHEATNLDRRGKVESDISILFAKEASNEKTISDLKTTVDILSDRYIGLTQQVNRIEEMAQRLLDNLNEQTIQIGIVLSRMSDEDKADERAKR